jgi:toxin-antitoxin system PIN domain toxin
MTVHLLDVNVLLALADPQHIHHQVAHSWFASRDRRRWATCPVTEDGFVRIASHPSYPNRPGEASVALELLRGMCAADGHTFWADSISLREALTSDSSLTHRHVTDVYLLALAVSNGGRLATLDQHIPVSVVRGGPATIEVIPVD